MSKELNIIEALRMDIGTRFNIDEETGIVVIKGSSEFEDELKEHEGFLSNKFLCWEDGGEKLELGDWESELKFTPIQKPITFMEAIETQNKFKCDISNLNLKDFENSDMKYCKRVIKAFNQYMTLEHFIYLLDDFFFSDDQREILTNAKFYVEE